MDPQDTNHLQQTAHGSTPESHQHPAEELDQGAHSPLDREHHILPNEHAPSQVKETLIHGAMAEEQPEHGAHMGADMDCAVHRPEVAHAGHPAGHRAQVSRAGHDEHAAHVTHTGHEQLFRQRFWVCLILSIPVLLFSPMLQMWFRFTMPAFPDSGWVGLLFSVIVFLYGDDPDLARHQRRLHL